MSRIIERDVKGANEIPLRDLLRASEKVSILGMYIAAYLMV